MEFHTITPAAFTLEFLGVQCERSRASAFHVLSFLILQVCFLDFGVAVPSSASFRVVGGARLTVSKSLRHSGVFNGLHFQCRALNRTSREPFSILVVAGHMLAIKSWNTELQRRWYRILELYRIINKVR